MCGAVDYGAAMNLSVTQVFLNAKKADGIFFPSCLDHGVATSTKIQGATYPRLVGDWFWARNELPHRVRDTCDTGGGLPCNPSCAGVRPAPPSPPSRQCESELTRLCGRPSTQSACIACAEQHTKPLVLKGCTREEVEALCSGGAR